MNQANTPAQLPDVAATDRAGIHAPLDRVGMAGLALPFRLQDETAGVMSCQGQAQVFVNICRPDVKGIHMSRLYLLLEEVAEQQVLSPALLEQFLLAKLETHRDISDSAAVVFECDYMLRRPALKSQYQGWKSYPLKVMATLENNEVCTELVLKVPYSSTCPCSASLSRQLLARAMLEDFVDQPQIDKETLRHWLLSERGSVATPHSQRSWAEVRLKLVATDSFPISRIIDQVEAALGTPVQTAVKREDEQAFAQLNGSNLMFCEDAARRVRNALLALDEVTDFWLRVEHQESLHAHDAVAITTKGVDGGYAAQLKL
ncbi:MAG: GTP cyclohydrolase FolE2 [Marinobacterium sp.]|nr:GTP cyclohydrolase FolE2 [Marinobacterium sp.]